MIPDDEDFEYKPAQPLDVSEEVPEQAALGAPPPAPDPSFGNPLQNDVPDSSPGAMEAGGAGEKSAPGRSDLDGLSLGDFTPGERRRYHFLGRYEEMAREHEKRASRPASPDELNGFAAIAKASAIRAEPFTDDEVAIFKERGQMPGGGIARLSDEKPASDAPAAAPASSATSTPAPASPSESKPAAESTLPAAESAAGNPPPSPSVQETLVGGAGSDKVTLDPPPKPEAEGAPPQKADGEPNKDEGGFLGWLKSLFGGSKPDDSGQGSQKPSEARPDDPAPIRAGNDQPLTKDDIGNFVWRYEKAMREKDWESVDRLQRIFGTYSSDDQGRIGKAAKVPLDYKPSMAERMSAPRPAFPPDVAGPACRGPTEKEAAVPVDPSGLAPPAYKKEFLDKQPGAWKAFNDALSDSGADLKKQFVYREIFAAEGGPKPTNTSRPLKRPAGMIHSLAPRRALACARLAAAAMAAGYRPASLIDRWPV
jgi:hypothetical protein